MSRVFDLRLSMHIPWPPPGSTPPRLTYPMRNFRVDPIIKKQVTERFLDALSILKNSFIKDVGTLAGATAFAQILSILSSFIITRLYTPEDFGTLAIFNSLIAQALVLTSLRYEWAIPLPKNEKVAVDLLMLCGISILGITVLSSIGIIVGGHHILLLLDTPSLNPYLWLFPLVLLFGGCYQALNYWALRQKDFKLIAKTKLSQSLGTIGSQLALGLFTTGPLGLLVGAILSQVLGTASLAVSLWQTSKDNLKPSPISNLKTTLQQYSRFPFFSAPSSFFNTAGLAAPALLIAFFYGPNSAGMFALIERISSIPANIIGRSISQVFMAKVAPLIQTDPLKIKFLHRQLSTVLLAINILIGMVLFTGPWLIPFLFGQNWKESGFMAQYMSINFVATLTISPLSLLEWLGKQDWMFIWNTARLILVYLGFIVANKLHLSAIHAVGIFSMIMSGLYFILLILNRYSINQIITNFSKPSLT